ncbi:MAG: tetratricopeptide repeat protein [Candidatus Aminicenantes bacterium]|nr:tetratricopeptide repeat protein [Candidatus Aminicenantes bacterium]
MAEKRISILKKANKYFKQQKYDPAIKEYKKVLNIKPDDLEVRRIIGDIELKSKNIKGAIEQFEWMADYYLKEGFFTKAIAMYKRISRIDPKYDKASFRLAELYTRQGLIIEAKQIYLDMAEEFKRNSNQRRALDMYKKILEFDRNNIKMRLLLADNFLREKLLDQAVNEYLIAFDILLNKKDFAQVEELAGNVIKKVKNIKLIEKLVYAYKVQEKDDEAIELLKGLGSDLFKNKNLLKMLGELYFKKDLIDDAESIFKKITEIDPTESEVLLKLGKVYLHREEYDKTFDLFLPIIDSYMKDGRVEDATAMLRLIIASNNLYFPALTKLASIFRETGKKTNLIALNESLIPLFEANSMHKELQDVLSELIRISDTPINYEEKLASLSIGEPKDAIETEEVESVEDDRELEIVTQGLRVAEESVKLYEYDNALETLRKIKNEYPGNSDVNLKLYDVYKKNNEISAAISVGKELLTLFKSDGDDDQYTEILNDLANLAPEDEKIIELSGEEKTNIDIDFDQEELDDQINDIENSGMQEIDLEYKPPVDDNVLVLSEEDSIIEPTDKGSSDRFTSVSGYLSEIDFYINDGYYSDAEKLTEELLEKYPESEEIKARIQKLQQVKVDRIEKMASAQSPDSEPEDADSEVSQEDELKIEFTNQPPEIEIELTEASLAEHTNSSTFKEDSNYQIEMDSSRINTDEFEAVKEDSKILSDNAISNDPSIFGTEDSILDLPDPEPELPELITTESDPKDVTESAFEIDLDSISIQAEEDQNIIDFSEISNKQYEIEVEEPEDLSDVIIDKIDEDLIVQSPVIEKKEDFEDQNLSSSGVLLSLDNAIEEDVSLEDSKPFEELSSVDIELDSEEELLKEEVTFPNVAHFVENENVVSEELSAIEYWLKELEKQRTSTVEKNMMEIFEEFKKGVDEKIGEEDFDTRYNLGIAYKEMGLLEEAIHEFLISSKHPVKFFDSAGLLGMCFREKGLMDDAITWFKKALDDKGRKSEEYLAVKYELVVTYKIKENYKDALEVIDEISKINPNYRDISDLKKSLV